ncbi:hypothetical protein WJX73_005192 [Symbiochloris irregularis]|uniref:Condensin-2 complex subunit H2 n=1 Tax=Symbiochloris irregularis TaxID=706552 RepID=A0AAW1Q2M5_9CHLO
MGTLSQTSEDSRFSHLTQPIRDLAANWDVDVASELEDYLETLEEVTFAFEGGPTLNFAEAALVIQGSASIYSRKVDFLRDLVYQALDFLTQRKQKDQRRKAQENVEDEDFADDEEQFLNLDDTLEEGVNIDLEDIEVVVQTPAVRIPAALLALEDAGIGDGNGDAGSFQIKRCCVHKSGALLLEARDGSRLDEFLRPMDEASCAPDHTADEAPFAGGGGADHGPADDDAAPQDYDGHGMDCGGGDSDGDHNELPAYDEMDAGPMQDEREQAGNAVGQQPTWLEGAQAGDSLREPEGNQQEQPASPVWDPFAPLDPNDPGDLPIRPYRRARKRRGKQKACQKAAPALEGLLAGIPGFRGLGPLNVLSFPEFEYALKRNKQQEGVSGKSRQQRRGQGTGPKPAALSAFTREDAAASMTHGGDHDEEDGYGDDGPPPDAAGLQSDGDADDFGPPDMGGQGEDDWGAEGDVQPPLWYPSGLDDAEAALSMAQQEEVTYEDICRAHIEEFIAAAAAAETQTALGTRVSDWRTKIAPALEEQEDRQEFDMRAVGAELLKRMQDLSMADELQSATEPLQVQEMSFDQIAGAPASWQVARNFSALLQLVNAGNVGIVKGPEDSVSADADAGSGQPLEDPPFRLRLLCLVPADQCFKDLAFASQQPATEDEESQQPLLSLDPDPLQPSNRPASKPTGKSAGKAQPAKRRRKAA